MVRLDNQVIKSGGRDDPPYKMRVKIRIFYLDIDRVKYYTSGIN